MLDNVTYLDAFHRDAAALAVAAGRGLEAPVSSCPGWTVATLLTHLTGLYAYSVKLVEGRPLATARARATSSSAPTAPATGWYAARRMARW